MKNWYVYIIKCKNGELYTGITIDVEKRLTEHVNGKGSKYLRGKMPLKLVYQKKVKTRSEATKQELKIKKLSKINKERLINKLLEI